MDVRKVSKRVVMVMFEGAQVLDVTAPVAVFGLANRYALVDGSVKQPPYEIVIVAPSPDAVRLSSGIRLQPDASLERFRGPIDTLLVAGGDGVFDALDDVGLIAWLQGRARHARRVASVCNGTFLLAEAGLLDGMRVTTHWAVASQLARRYPQLEVDVDAIFVRAGKVSTSAGVTAGIDLALALVEDDLGRELALAIARGLVVFLRRPGGQTQFSRFLYSQTSAHEDFAALVDWLIENLDRRVTVDDMAARCRMSPRNFARVFHERMGTTPARFLEQLRLQKARVLLEQSNQPVKSVAASCGFASHEHMRRSFQRRLKVNPQDYRARF